MSSELTNWIGIIGSLASLVGLPIAIWQIRKVRRVAEAAKTASFETRKAISKNLLIADISTCTKNIEEIKLFVRVGKNESALIRVTDLISYLIKIDQRARSSKQTIEVEFDEMLSQLSIIRGVFEGRVLKTSAKIDSSKIFGTLSKISDDLNRLIGGAITAIEKGE